jgi:hypothetical protein
MMLVRGRRTLGFGEVSGEMVGMVAANSKGRGLDAVNLEGMATGY